MKLKSTLLVFALMLSSNSYSTLIDEIWDEYNDPSRISRDFNYTLSELKTKAFTSGIAAGWSGSYWPDREGSIALRSSQNSHRLLKIEGLLSKDNKFDYESPKLEDLKKMKPEQIMMLSPAEKLDIISGRYDYPLRSEVYTRASKKDPGWEGICHGWSPAALNHEQPNPVSITNEDGIEVKFGASDIKALLGYFYAYYAPQPAVNIAIRCKSKFGILGGKACKGINAGTLHVMLTNLIGERNHGFVVDITRGSEVWNQPVIGYESTLLKKELDVSHKELKIGIAKKVEVRTILSYVVESKQSAKPVSTSIKRLALRYTLDLDNAGKIIGGDWKSAQRPDFAWILEKQDFHSHPLFEKLTEIYEISKQAKPTKE